MLLRFFVRCVLCSLLHFIVFETFLLHVTTGVSNPRPHLDNKTQQLLNYFTERIHHGENINFFPEQNTVLNNRKRNADENFHSVIRNAELNRARSQLANAIQLDTTIELSKELQKLERRERWSPPGSNFNSEYSLYSGPINYGGNQILSFARKLQQIGSTTRQNSVSVDSLIRWKSSTQQRIERLEHFFENSEHSLAGHSSSSNSLLDVASQQDKIEVNSRQIQAIQNSIAHLQEDVLSLRQLGSDKRSNSMQATSSATAGLQSVLGDSALFTRQQNSISENSRQIESIQTTLSVLQRSVDALEPPAERNFDTMRRINGLSHRIGANYDVTHDIRSILQDHEVRLNDHDVIMRKKSIDITSLQHQLFRSLKKGKVRDSAIKALQATFTNGSISEVSNMLSQAFSPTGNQGSPNNVFKRLQEHENKINRLQKTADQSQICCLKINAVSRRMESTTERVNEARTRADESAVAVRVQKRNLDEMTNKMETQRVVIKRIQDTVVAQQRSNIRRDQNLQDVIRFKAEEINSTVSLSVAKKLEVISGKITSQVSTLGHEVMQLEDDLASTTRLVENYAVQQAVNNDDIRRHLDIAFPRLLNDLMKNYTIVSTRISSNEQKTRSIMVRVGEIIGEAVRQKMVVDTSVNQNRKSFEKLEAAIEGMQQRQRNQESVRKETLEETVSYLNSSFYYVRAAVQRQADRGASLFSRLERLHVKEERIKEVLAQLGESFEEHMVNFYNETMSLRSIIRSDDNSLRRTLGSRFEYLERKIDAFNTSKKEYADQILRLSKTVMNIRMETFHAVERLKRKTNALVAEQESISALHNSLEEEVARRLEDLNNTVPDLLDVRLNGIEKSADLIGKELANFEQRMDEFLPNATRRDQQIAILRSHLTRVSSSMMGTRHVTSKLNRKTDDIMKTVSSSNFSIGQLKLKLDSLSSDLRAAAAESDTNRYQITMVQNNLQREISAIQRSRNTTRQLVEDLKLRVDNSYRKTEHSLQETNSRVDRVTDRLLRMNNAFSQENEKQRSRLVSLETLNSTLRSTISECLNNIAILQGTIGDLRSADDTLFESIDDHARALTEHGKLHRNLSALSDGVHSVISEHSQALDTVRNVVVQLNETVEEEKDHIDEKVSSQIQRHLRQIKGLRFIMKNFTSLLQTILNDKLDQDISIASLRMRQRSVIETIDSHSASIDRLNYDNSRIKRSITSLEMIGEENVRQIANAMDHLVTHNQDLRRLHGLTFRMADLASQLNTSLTTQAEEIEEIDRFLESNREFIYELVETISSLQEDVSDHKTSADEITNNILSQQSTFIIQNAKQNKSIVALESISSETMATMKRLHTNVDHLDSRITLLTGVIGSLAYLEGNVTDLKGFVDEVLMISSENMATNQDLLRNFQLAEERLSAIEEDKSARGTAIESQFNSFSSSVRELEESKIALAARISFLSNKVSALEDSVSQKIYNASNMTSHLHDAVASQQDMTLSLMRDMLQQRSSVNGILQKVWEHEASVTSLNRTSLVISHVTEQLKSKDRGYIRSFKKVMESTEALENSLQMLESAYWNSISKINELVSRTDVIEDQVSLFKAKFTTSRVRVQSSMRDLRRKMNELQLNMSEAEDRITYLELDQDSTFNITTSIFDNLEEQSSRINILNQSLGFEVADVFASLASTIASIQQSMFDVNETLTRDVSGITTLLVDFQLAFDTSGRQMERQHHELNTLYANSTNYFDYFSSAVDYLRQIAHQTNEAVGENSERVRVLNSTVIYLQVAIPSLLQPLSFLNHSILAEEEMDDTSVNAKEVISQTSGATKMSTNSIDHDDYDEYNNEEVEDYDVDTEYFAQAKGRPVEYRDFSSHLEDYPAGMEYNIDAILTGEADEARIERRLASLVDSSYIGSYNNEDDYYYDTDEP